MTPRFTTLRTMSHYSLARVRVLCTTRTLSSVLMVSSLLVLAVMGTSAAWRARTSGEESPLAEGPFAVSPLAELVPQTTEVSAPQDATTVPTVAPVPPPTTTDTAMVTPQRAAPRDPVSPTMRSDEQTPPVSRLQGQALPHTAVRQEHACPRTERRGALTHVERARDGNASPSRAAARVPVPVLPRVQVVSVSSTAVLIEHHGRRQIVRRGARLHGWTLARLAPTGVTLRRVQHQAQLPLSFAARVSSNR